LRPHLKDVELDQLRVSDISAMFAAINERNDRISQGIEGDKITGIATQHRILATLRNALNDMRQGLLSFNPASLVTLAPGKRSRARVWTDARIAAWRAVCAREVQRTIEASPIGHANIFKIWRRPASDPHR
jgi:hypothetical protein